MWWLLITSVQCIINTKIFCTGSTYLGVNISLLQIGSKLFLNAKIDK